MTLADTALKDEANQQTVKNFSESFGSDMQVMGIFLKLSMFFGDWLYKQYKLSKNDCKSFLRLVISSSLPPANSNL